MYFKDKKPVDIRLKKIMSQHGLSPAAEVKVTIGVIQTYRLYSDSLTEHNGWIMANDDNFDLSLIGNLKTNNNICCIVTINKILNLKEWCKITHLIENARLQRKRINYKINPRNHIWQYIIINPKTNSVTLRQGLGRENVKD